MEWFSNFFGGNKKNVVSKKNSKSRQEHFLRDYRTLKRKVKPLLYDPTGLVKDLERILKTLNSNTDFDKLYDQVKYNLDLFKKALLTFEAAGDKDLYINSFKTDYLNMVLTSKEFIKHLTDLNECARLASRAGEVSFLHLERYMKRSIKSWHSLIDYWDKIDNKYKNKIV